ncbi:Toll/interleukin-1 receptor domain-containing protein [Tanacetum coccineum]
MESRLGQGSWQLPVAIVRFPRVVTLVKLAISNDAAPYPQVLAKAVVALAALARFELGLRHSEYDVFLSFRGKDTCNTFVGHLYKALKQHGIQTYKDDEKIEKGKKIDNQLKKSIEDSRYYIIVFSKKYTSSSWCLDELVKIMECRKASEQTQSFMMWSPRKSASKVGWLEKLLETKLLELDTHDVRMIEIWGMGGGGKTTLARAIFDRISIQFDGIVFVENVREVSKSFLYGLNKLQQQVLCNVLSNKNITARLAGSNWEAELSLPRDKQVLLAHRVKFINGVNLLSHAEAISLFSKHAFIRDILIEGHEELLKQVVQYAYGLPLTIKVLGSLLCGQNMPQLDTIERLKIIPLKTTLEKLKLSYNGLKEDCKEIFLDVACLLKGWLRDYAVIALESCGFFAEVGLRVLEHKSLITISEDGELDMHEHIVEMVNNPSLAIAPNLKTASLQDCLDLVELHMPTECPKLVNLDLSNNAKLMILHLGITLNLKTVSLKGCHAWVKLHILAECLKLVTLNLTYCKLVAELPEDIGRVNGLRIVGLMTYNSGPQNLEEPASIEALRELCDKNYHQLLPLIAEKMQKEKEQQNKLKAVKAAQKKAWAQALPKHVTNSQRLQKTQANNDVRYEAQ